MELSDLTNSRFNSSTRRFRNSSNKALAKEGYTSKTLVRARMASYYIQLTVTNGTMNSFQS